MATDFQVTPLTLYSLATIAIFAGPLMIFELWVDRSGDPMRLTKVRWPIRAAVYSYAAIMLMVFQPMVHRGFIYAQF